MICARSFQSGRRHSIRYTASIAAIFLFATACAAQSKPATSAGQQQKTEWAKELNKYPGLLPEIGQLVGKLQSEVQFPAPRAESRLLPLLPESDIACGAFPNYGEATHQALQIFRQELQQSAVLRDWWTHGDMATAGPKLEDFFEKLYQFHQYLGDEIVVSGAMNGKELQFLFLVEVRKPGLKKFLEQAVDQFADKAKPGVRLLDSQELANAKEKAHSEEFLVLVRPDFVVGASDLVMLRSFNAKLDHGGREFASAAFGKRVLQEYNGGVTVLAAADLRTVLKSSKFLDSLPGHSANASALLYQNAVGIAAMQIRQVSPELADAFANFSQTAPANVVSVYGEESAIREISSNSAFDVPSTLFVAAMAIPNLLRSRMAANESAAVGSVRTVNTAQATYQAAYPKRGYAPNLAAFGPDPRGPNFQSPDHANFIDESLANQTCTGDAWCTRSGYQFRVTAICKLRVCNEYVVVATPVNANTGTRSFCSTSDGVIHLKAGPPLTSAVSAAECRSWPSLR